MVIPLLANQDLTPMLGGPQCYSYLLFTKRESEGEFYLLMKEMKLQDNALFFAYFCMCPTKYEHIMTMVAPRIQKY